LESSHLEGQEGDGRIILGLFLRVTGCNDARWMKVLSKEFPDQLSKFSRNAPRDGVSKVRRVKF